MKCTNEKYKRYKPKNYYNMAKVWLNFKTIAKVLYGHPAVTWAVANFYFSVVFGFYKMKICIFLIYLISKWKNGILNVWTVLSYRGIYLNQSNALFKEVINSEIRIDETMLICESNRMICIIYTTIPNMKYRNIIEIMR